MSLLTNQPIMRSWATEDPDAVSPITRLPAKTHLTLYQVRPMVDRVKRQGGRLAVLVTAVTPPELALYATDRGAALARWTDLYIAQAEKDPRAATALVMVGENREAMDFIVETTEHMSWHFIPQKEKR